MSSYHGSARPLFAPHLHVRSAEMTNKAVGKFLNRTSKLIELTGGNVFRARAFARAARAIERLDTPVATLVASGEILTVDGIGKGLVEQLTELLERGTFQLAEELEAALPPGVPDLLLIPGLGTKKVRQLWQDLGITSLDELEQAAKDGRIATLPGFGTKVQTNLLSSVPRVRMYRAHKRYADGAADAHAFMTALAETPGVSQVAFTGALRRGMDILAEAELLISCTDEVWEELSTTATTDASVPDGPLPMLQLLRDGALPCRLYRSQDQTWGKDLALSTGPALLVAALQQQQQRSGPMAPPNTPAAYPTEESYLGSLGFVTTPPELRDHPRALDHLQGSLPVPKLIERAHLRGTLHNHSTYSDGAHTLDEMAQEARALGYAYLGICDHSQSLTVAHGLRPDEVARQHEHIERLNDAFAQDGGTPFKIFRGIESDILIDGSLDYTDDILRTFDLVVASIHTGFNMTAAEATSRLIKAIAHPATTILGHPTGRLLLAREGYPIDHEAVLQACAAHGVAVELNANPYRLDIDWRWIHRAMELNVLVSINPDAHSKDQLSLDRFGVLAARKGGLSAEGCFNAMTLSQMQDYLDRRKQAWS